MSHVVLFFAGLGALVLLSSAPGAEPISARPMELDLDATQAPRKLFQARLVIPAAPGPLTLSYPQWIPGEHSPSGPIADLSGLKLRAGGQALSWRRDEVDLYTFHCTVPEGADRVEATLDYLGPLSKEGFTSGASCTDRLAVLNWNQVLLYPRGRSVREQKVRAALTLPPGWKFSTPLASAGEKEGHIQFATVSLETLVDSPVLCGAYLKEIPLRSVAGPPHFLVLACDHPSGLAISAELLSHYERLVAEAKSLFGAQPFRSYRFLVSLSDQLRSDAIEHHECSDNRLPERFFVDETYRKHWGCTLLPHEYAHSWNGKYRRPAGLATADFQQPMQTKLLWVYEGMAEYLGLVLTARSGLFTPELARENVAFVVDWARNQGGRTWRPLEDTTVAAPHLYYAHPEWSSRRRGVDFYDEGTLLWLDVDTFIREKSSGKKSLDDFCRAFFGGQDGQPQVKRYTLEEVVKGLNEIAAHDWKGFLEQRVSRIQVEPPLDGLRRGGWNMVYRDKAGDLFSTRETDEKTVNLTPSLGLLLKEDGQVVDVIPGKPADQAGIGPGMKLLGVNQRRFTADRLRQAVQATQGGREKLLLLLENNDYFKTVQLHYAEGPKYPHLERLPGKADLLSEVFRPRAKERR